MNEMIISIEGIDGVGKGTQSKLLYERFLSNGIDAEFVSFPRYNTFFGKMVGAYLNGAYGGLSEVPVEFASMLYALDRWHFWENRKKKPTSAQSVLVIDRYVSSNIAHQSIKVLASKRQNFINWALALEHDIFSVPKPTVVVLLDLPVQIASDQVLKKPKRDYTDKGKDLHEQDTEYLTLVHSAFLSLGKSDPNTRIIDCHEGKAVRSIEDIAEDVWAIAQNTIQELQTIA